MTKHVPKFAKDTLTKLCRLISGAVREGVKINFKITHLIGKQVLSKHQRALSNREKLQKCRQSTPQNLLNINLPNLVGCFQELSEKEQKFDLRCLIYFKGKAEAKNKEHYQREKNSENVLNLILDALFGRARPKIC